MNDCSENSSTDRAARVSKRIRSLTVAALSNSLFMRHGRAEGAWKNCSENRGSLGTRASSPAVVFKNRAISNNAAEAANALLFREAVVIGQILRARRPRSQGSSKVADNKQVAWPEAFF